MSLGAIQEFVQAYAENIAEVLQLDVTILDEHGIRISGTGAYQDFIGQLAPQGSFFESVLKTGRPGMILDTKKETSQCIHCKFISQCRELATIGFPIFKSGKPIGVIGLIGFSQQQRKTIVHQADKLVQYLQHASTLLENKLMLTDLQPVAGCQIKEQDLQQTTTDSWFFKDILGTHFSIQRAIHQARKVVNSPSTVLLLGKSGTGKEGLAKAIHHESQRKNKPFIVVNCAAIPEALLESELFGYMAGTFTGAKKEGHAGKFELAEGGTIFLDEVGDLPLSLQPKLLRFLQEKEVQRIGSPYTQKVDVRVIAATHVDLAQMVEQGHFREDLYYRLNVIPISLPSLRERKEDIPQLVQAFIEKYNRYLGKHIVGLDPDLLDFLKGYAWPGNIRELENAVEYMVNMTENVVLGLHDLPGYILDRRKAAEQANPLDLARVLEPMGQEELTAYQDSRDSLDDMLQKFEKELLSSMLSQAVYQNDKQQLAKRLKISLSTLYRKLEKYNL